MVYRALLTNAVSGTGHRIHIPKENIYSHTDAPCPDLRVAQLGKCCKQKTCAPVDADFGMPPPRV